jgi:hypothetical protein
MIARLKGARIARSIPAIKVARAVRSVPLSGVLVIGKVLSMPKAVCGSM